MDNLERTGRTGRMLNDAVRKARDGRAVYVVAADGNQAKEFERRLPDDLGIKVEIWGGVSAQLDIQSMRLRGAHPNCLILIDHYAIERAFGPLLSMLHRFDRE